MEVSWIEYKDKKILFSNYDGCITADEMINILYKERSILLQQEKKYWLCRTTIIHLVLQDTWKKL